MPMELEEVVEVLDRVRARNPLTHCLTNHVVKNFTANALLAVGAAPAMVEHPAEARAFASMADGLLINLGTLDDDFMEAARNAVVAAQQAGKPWTLDPVAVGPLRVRTDFAQWLVDRQPSFIRGNASEILALAGEEATGRGVDSRDAAETAAPAAKRLAARCGAIVLVTGANDYLTDGEGMYVSANGHPLLTRITGVGCAQGALMSTCGAVAESSMAAAAASALIIAVSGEIAAERSQRPGSFQIALLDALDELDAETLRQRAKLRLIDSDFR